MLSHDGASVPLAVTTARDCTWTASSDAPWVQVSPASGQGNGTVTAAVAANTQTRLRTGAIAINDTTVSISQASVPCRFELSSEQVRTGFEGGRTSVRVTTTDGCEWRASSGEGWIRVLTDRGNGPGSVDLEIGRNEGSERSAIVTIAERAVAVSQAQFSTAPPPVPSICTFTIDPDRLSFRSAGGGGSIRVVTEPGCSWTAASQASWIMTSRPGGNGPDTLDYQVAAHTSTAADRTGSVVVAGRTHNVSQDACALALDPGLQSFGSPGGQGSIRVVTGPGCTWTAASTAEWISISRSSGSGPEALSYHVAVYASTANDRSGGVVVSGRTHTVRQAAYRPEEIAREGFLSDVTGSCPTFSFVVGGRVFITDHRTRFDAECSKIRNGARAFVRGTLLPDGRILTTQVDIDD